MFSVAFIYQGQVSLWIHSYHNRSSLPKRQIQFDVDSSVRWLRCNHTGSRQQTAVEPFRIECACCYISFLFAYSFAAKKREEVIKEVGHAHPDPSNKTLHTPSREGGGGGLLYPTDRPTEPSSRCWFIHQRLSNKVSETVAQFHQFFSLKQQNKKNVTLNINSRTRINLTNCRWTSLREEEANVE